MQHIKKKIFLITFISAALRLYLQTAAINHGNGVFISDPSPKSERG